MSAYNKFDSFSLNVLSGLENFAANSYKVMVSDVAPVRTNKVKADITEIAAGNGYVAGGVATAMTIADNAGVSSVSAADTPIAATSAGPIAPWRYAILYNATTGNLVSWFDYGAEVTITASNSTTVKFPGGLLNLS